ncbi:hypothetical protein OG792_31995 [Micromonospora sp. NBC_01699]|uniref:hypothetical protein n=1 Tax=Micromonospora sp. NBC_01699 TaxID=2975984 RepID=UPI002E2DC4A1|nr:hypothetical protein [Micromonospora sp. NBC_01699]
MTRTSRIWRLYAGDELLGDLVVDGGDFPWLAARFEPLPAYRPFRPLFDEDVRLLDGAVEDVEAQVASDRAMRAAAIALADPDGFRVPEFLLHIRGEQAWWRWNDEPFDDD